MHRLAHRGVRAALIALLVTMLAACDEDDPVGPMSEVAGTYEATTMTDGSTDFLALGSSLRMTLGANGTTSGTFFVPGGDEDGGDLEADLTGTYTLDGSRIEFQHEADTFIRDAVWEHEDGQIRTVSGSEIDVVLTERTLLTPQ